MESTTASGLLVSHRMNFPRDVPPNDNPVPEPPVSVGPNASEGYGNTHVMYDAGRPPPPGVQAWSGWPVEWSTPNWNQTAGYGRAGMAATCADLNSRQLASFPTYVTRGVDVIDAPTWTNDPEPSLYAEWGEFAKQVVNCLQMRGEAFVYATGRFASGMVARMVALNPDQMRVEWDGTPVYTWSNSELPAADVCHIKYQSYPGNLRGIGPLEWCWRNMIGAEALEQYQMNLAARGGVPWAVLRHPMRLNSTQATDLQQAWVAGAVNRQGAPAVLSGGIELDTLTLSPKDMALLDLRIFDEQRICAAFGVPPFLVGLPQADGLTYSNATSLYVHHWRTCLRPMAQTIGSALSKWALPRGQRLEFNRDEYIRPDMVERANAYSVLHGIQDDDGTRALTVPEIRTFERFTQTPDTPATEDAADLSTVGAI